MSFISSGTSEGCSVMTCASESLSQGPSFFLGPVRAAQPQPGHMPFRACAFQVPLLLDIATLCCCTAAENVASQCGPSMPRTTRRLNPNKPASAQTLRDLGVHYWKMDADAYETDERLAAIRKLRNYSWMGG